MGDQSTGEGPSGGQTLGRILALALALRLAVALVAYGAAGPGALIARDSSSYLRPAEELARTGQFTRDGAPEILRTPGYPLFLIPGLLTGHVAFVTVVLQALLGTATVYLVYGATRHLGGAAPPGCGGAAGSPAPAQVAALLYAFEPLSILYGAKLLSETLFAFAVTGALWALLSYLTTDRLKYLMAAAVALVGAAYVRPIGYYLPGLVAVVLVAVLANRSRTGAAVGLRRRRLTHWLVFVALAVVGLGIWHGRNRLVAEYDGFCAIADVNLYFYQAAAVRAALDGEPYYRVQERWGYRDEETYLKAYPQERTWSAGRRFSAQRRRGLQMLAAHPWTYAGIHLRGLVRVLVDPGGLEHLRLFGLYPRAGGLLGLAIDEGMVAAARQVWARQPAAFALNAVLGAVLVAWYALAAIGLIAARPRGAGLALVVAVALYLLILSGGAVSLSRFRHPIMPALCMLAGLGWVAVAGRIGSGRQGGGAGP